MSVNHNLRYLPVINQLLKDTQTAKRIKQTDPKILLFLKGDVFRLPGLQHSPINQFP